MHEIKKGTKRLMTQLDDQFTAAAAQTGQAAADAANRVIDTINANNAALADLQAKFDADETAIAALQAEIAAGTITPAVAQTVLNSLADTNTALAAIDTTPVAPVVVTPAP